MAISSDLSKVKMKVTYLLFVKDVANQTVLRTSIFVIIGLCVFLFALLGPSTLTKGLQEHVVRGKYVSSKEWEPRTIQTVREMCPQGKSCTYL